MSAQTSKSVSPNENLDPDDVEVRNSRKRLEPHTPSSSRRSEKRFRTQSGRDEFAVAGRVSGVHLQNFMCHANLAIDFDTKHNNCFYIGGPNGSGKSALFAAINIGLGGRGSDNDRGNSVKSYIKDGTQSSKIQIFLTNEGVNSNPDYGETVMIERTINQTTSNYLMKSITNHGYNREETIISKKKSDVDRLVSKFNIHLSNPAFWMSQDRSRSFLANFKPGNVYHLYQEATNLEKIKQAYGRFAATLEETDRIMSKKKVEMEKRTKELIRLQEVRKRHDDILKENDRIRVWQWNLLFCAIRDNEDEMKIVLNKIAQNDKMTNDNKDKLLANRNERRDAMRKVEEIQEELEDKKNEYDDTRTDLTMIRNRIDDEESKMRTLEREIKNKKMEISKFDQNIKSCRAKIREIAQKNGNCKRKQKLEHLEAELDAIKKEKTEMEQHGDFEELKRAKDECERKVAIASNSLAEVNGEISQLQRNSRHLLDNVKRFKAMKINKINKYGARMNDIVGMINKYADKFQKLPKGPLGKYISINDKKWSLPIEECIGSLANQFLCHNSQDSALLRKIFDLLKIPNHERPGLIVGRFLGHEHSQLEEPEPGFDTIYRMLTISDPDVHNAIIDKNQVEGIVLLENNKDARKYMGSDNPPQYALRAYTLDGSLAYAAGPNSQYRFYAGKGGRARGIFENEEETLNEEQIMRTVREDEERVKELNRNQLREATEHRRNCHEELGKANNALATFEKTLADVHKKELTVTRAIRDIEAALASEDGQEEIEGFQACIEEVQGKLPTLHDEVEQIQEKIKEENAKLGPTKLKKQKLEIELKAHQDAVHRTRVKLDTVRDKVDQYDNIYEQLDAKNIRLEAHKQAFFNEEVQLKVRREVVEKTVAESKKVVEKPPGVSDPADLTNFPPTAQAEKKYEEMRRKIALAKEEVDETVTLEVVQNFKNLLKREKYLCNRLTEIVENFNELLRNRIDLYPMLKKVTEMKIRKRFKELLDVRGHLIGDLEINNEKKTLKVMVTSTKESGESTSSGNAAGDARTLAQQIAENDEEDEDYQEEVSEEDESDEDEQPRRKKAKQAKKKKPRDLKGLSGGERSFVTAALVMALWEVMEQPFRMMDEFDVFMDMMNRKIVMDLLVQLATEKFPHNQFIFFTPQGIKELDKVDGLQIFEMNKVRD